MKKLCKKIVFGGIASTLLGGILFLVGCGANGFDFAFLSSIQIQQMEYVEGANTNITDLSLSFETTDILQKNSCPTDRSFHQLFI